jgi:hypothetical protein
MISRYASSGSLGDVEDLDDVGVLEEQRQPRLVEEHRDEPRVGREVGEDALDRDRLAEALQGLGDALEHLGLAAAAESLEHGVAGAHRPGIVTPAGRPARGFARLARPRHRAPLPAARRA